MRPQSRRAPRVVACAALYFVSIVDLTQSQIASLGQVNINSISIAHNEIWAALLKAYGRPIPDNLKMYSFQESQIFFEENH